MMAKKLCPKKVAKIARGISAPTLRTIRPKHVVAIKIAEGEKHGQDVEATNASQSVSFSSASDGKLPCITPNAMYYLKSLTRTILSEESMVLMGYPLPDLDIGANSERELAHMAGNGMAVRTIAAAMIIALALLDKSKFEAHLEAQNKLMHAKKANVS